jgi:hypothetical protein
MAKYTEKLAEMEKRIALLAGKEKEAGEKKIKAVKSEIAIIADIKEGTDHYKATEKKIDTLLNWTPGQIIRSGESKITKINRIFGTGTTAHISQPCLTSMNKIDLEKVEVALKPLGISIEGKDWFYASHLDGVKVIECVDSVLSLDRSKIPADWK